MRVDGESTISGTAGRTWLRSRKAMPDHEPN